MDLGPVELILLVFPGDRADPGVVSAVAEVVDRGYVTILDLLVLSRDRHGEVSVADFDDDLAGAGLRPLPVSGRPLLSDDDLELAREVLPPDGIAVVIVYEETWARRVARAVRAAGGDVALHVQLPRVTVEAANAAAAD
jgi:hypothetical protein